MSELKPGDLVTYYLEGWRTGHLEKIKGQVATIRPIAPRGASRVHKVKVPVLDVSPADGQRKSQP